MNLVPLREVHLITAVREPIAAGKTSPTRSHFATGKDGYLVGLDVDTGLLVLTRGDESRWVHCDQAREITPLSASDAKKPETKTAPAK